MIEVEDLTSGATMPASPSPAQSAASRANGALSRGPATPDGKARSAADATRHGLRGTSRTIPPEHAAGLAALRDALTARLAPADAVERHWVGEIAFALWQQQRLQAATAAALAYAEGDTDEPEAPTPALARTLARYRARIERDLRLAQEGLEAARRSRPRLPADPGLANPTRLRWLADRIEAGLADSAPANDTGEPEAQPRAESELTRRPLPGRSTATSAAGSRRWAEGRPRPPLRSRSRSSQRLVVTACYGERTS